MSVAGGLMPAGWLWSARRLDLPGAGGGAGASVADDRAMRGADDVGDDDEGA